MSSRKHGDSARKRRFRRPALVAAIVLVATLVSPAAAQAVPNDFLCLGVPDAGFVDVDPASVHKTDIDCLKAFGITSGTSPTTFDPAGAVSRWQMALFMMRLGGWDDLSGTEQGFADIASLPADTQVAINQLSQLGVSTGTSPTTFDPNGAVTRWQMALFLTRLIHAGGMVLPDGSGFGFTDIGALPQAQQIAINQLAQLGITTGIGQNLFGPDLLVSRDQMASFLIRTLKLLWTLPLAIQDSCTPPIPADGIETPGTVCEAATTYPQGETFFIRASWFVEKPLSPAFQTEFQSAGTRIELKMDGSPVVLAERSIALAGVDVRVWEAVYRGGLNGIHDFELSYYWNDELIVTYQTEVSFSILIID